MSFHFLQILSCGLTDYENTLLADGLFMMAGALRVTWCSVWGEIPDARLSGYNACVL